ncbi:hypothetical protein C1H46_019009 [Malus baccata]|uniref:Uncharacterized protein n=1 Tax=Malus baccata TaxID=106549 RepID=A0A540M9G8_MALBA|nr:hypothetical protein C1H46_019009 [Malus baccata]
MVKEAHLTDWTNGKVEDAHLTDWANGKGEDRIDVVRVGRARRSKIPTHFISQIICYLLPSRSGSGVPCRMDNEYNGTLQYGLILTALAYMTGLHKFKIQPDQMARMPLLLASGCRASNEIASKKVMHHSSNLKPKPTRNKVLADYFFLHYLSHFSKSTPYASYGIEILKAEYVQIRFQALVQEASLL